MRSYSKEKADEMSSLISRNKYLIESISSNIRMAGLNAISMPALQPTVKSSGLNGAIANAVAGPVAGVYAAAKTESDNKKAQQAYERQKEIVAEQGAKYKNYSRTARDEYSEFCKNESKILTCCRFVPEWKEFVDKKFEGSSLIFDSFTLTVSDLLEKNDIISLFIADRFKIISEVRAKENARRQMDKIRITGKKDGYSAISTLTVKQVSKIIGLEEN